MIWQEILQLGFFITLVLLAVKPLGYYMSLIYQGKDPALIKIMLPVERFIYRLANVNPKSTMDWKQYLAAMLVFNLFGALFAYMILRLQAYLPLNVENFPGLAADLALNTSSSLATNTGWQAYAGESTMSYLSQSLVVTTQGFLSAATGMTVLMALIRSLSRHAVSDIGNFWSDIVRSILYILLPLSILLAIILASQGVIQNYLPYQQATGLEINSVRQSANLIPMGPVASLVAIKQLGSYGAGFFNVNSAHPFENPNGLTNLLEMIALILIPAALCYTFGVIINQRRQGWAILIAMVLIFIPSALIVINAEHAISQSFSVFNLDINGNMEGKETRFGLFTSSLWATTTAASGNGSINAMHDSFMPLSDLVILILMHLGEIVFGGLGSGLYGMLMLVIITVFISGLMVGRTPEYLGKKIDPFDMKMVTLIVLIMPLTSLLLVAIATMVDVGTKNLGNPGAHGFTEILYAFSSMRSNNGSAFAGLSANSYFYNVSGAILMLINRYWIAIATLAMAGSLAAKKLVPKSAGTLPTHNLLFVSMLISFIIILGVLSFLPTLALGPIAEYISLKDLYDNT